ncbi:hypothetical protein [Lysobacter auxotrophicus]|uniref:DUF3619 family protein n=1 Tax=Lysobacter auxotrophicus TaxID=2992573 RepID=A0ABM8DAZ2_9GAMM|nr:hypothetical protein [Lysobacter auxotrophicus]BDU15699.1 DUF3619 family protein [Lysobacter auxotrophicus]
MTSREHDTITTNDERFDNAMRELHAQAVSQVSSATRARLRVARHAAARPTAEREPRRGFHWVLGSGLAAVFAIAIGLQLRPAQTPTPSASTPMVASAPTGASPFDADTAIAALDENPDLYLWLASNDDAVPSLEP